MSQSELEVLNEEEARQYIGGVIFVFILMVIGIIGNFHVLVVYIFRMKRSNPRIFIIFLAALDFLTCSIGMPFVIIDLRNPLTFTIIPACKILRFINYFIGISSALILLIIAIDRYRKVCIPLGRQITQGQAKILCLIALCISAALSWPAPVLYGHSTVQTKNPNITGVRCFTEDQFKSSIYQAIFNEMLIVIFFSMFIILVILYSLMARIIWKHDEFRRSFAVSGTTMKRRLKNIDIHSGESDIDISAVSSDVMLTLESSTRSYDIKTVHQTIGPVHSSFTQNSLDSTNSYIGDATNNAVRGRALDDARSDKALRSDGTDNGDDKKKSHYKNFLQLHIMKKTTIMMFLITAVFLISYIPHLTLKIVLFVKKDFLINMNFAEKLLYNTFVWCFFINNMANSLIYGFVDIRFRQNVISLYSRFCCRHRS